MGACGNVTHGLASVYPENDTAETIGAVALNMRAPSFYPVSTRLALCESDISYG